jgi:hypothetical protein
MKIIEKFLLSKYGDNVLCEDIIFESQTIVAVVDGATSKSQKLWNGLSGGLFAAKTLFNGLYEMKKDLNAIDTVHYLNNYLKSQIDQEEMPPQDRPMASVVLYNDKTRQIIRYGDCKIIINNKEFPRTNQNDITLANIRAKILLEALKNGKSIEDLMQKDIGREYILKELKNNAKYANDAGEKGYPAINGTTINNSFIDCYFIKDDSEIILASDGYPLLKPTLEQSEAELKRIITQDPLCISQYVSTKGIRHNQVSFDDRAYIRIKV